MKVFIDGMTCNHCKIRVEKALAEIEGIKRAVVNLEGGFAVVETEKDIPVEVLKEVIENTGYTFVRIEN
ncbi:MULTISPECIES: heavy-metal-associated domain-containing protein [Kosmotoga]|jgi:copper chaperone CopZ|uniref:Heavy metal transport/detoxification protein n=1 Tax=Kosmotoga olearia (strain ATCC BAA-1733 / DSM 21960 / TBF 19.5.1) TaxID=521045 RepID=C5CI07_KOSOT|nr:MULTISPECIES: heavy metal-associated domain-containing protein [Kosmotoga]ACR79786.1 Heavy metal transport/detoxification protein [Kosmotoga olearia TBF 19.5.1]OAA21440.1 heavy metal transport/detoxification protein [Kosmotoga sp. DU53]